MAAEWVEYGQSQRVGTYFYDKESLTYERKGIVKLWNKIVYTEEAKANKINLRKKNGRDPRDLESLSYTLSSVTFNCNTKETDVSSVAHYDISGKVLESADFKTPEFRSIPPDSAADTLRKIVCKKR
jgi:hypothetical protein